MSNCCLYSYLDDAVRMCTNISSASVIAHIQLCEAILPIKWHSSARSALCEHTTSRPQVEAAVKCAIEAASIRNPKLSDLEAAQVCTTETSSGPVLSCVKAIAQIPTSASGSAIVNAGKHIINC